MISIIIPFYCTKKEYFDKCMTSILQNKVTEIEILIIDDGSPAEFQEIVDGYASDQRVRVFHEKHTGVSNARNIGIQNATGEWLMFVDSDDYLESGYAEKLINLTKETDADIIIFNGYGDRYGKSIKNKYFIRENRDYGETISEKCALMGAGLSLGRTPVFARCYYTLGAPCSKLLNVNFIKKNDIWFDTNVKFAEDTLFSLEAVWKANHIYYSDLYLYHYNMNDNSATGKYRKGLAVEMDFFFKTIWKFIKDNNLEDTLKESYCIRAFLEGQRCLRQEFYHKKNHDADRNTYARTFLKTEPYVSGLNADYPYMKRLESRIATFMLKHNMFLGYIGIYNLLEWVRKKTYVRNAK